MKRSCENKQQLTLCHIWQWSSSPHRVSANPFLSGEKGGFLQTCGTKTDSGDTEDTSQLPCQYHYSFNFLYMMLESYISFPLRKSPAHIKYVLMHTLGHFVCMIETVFFSTPAGSAWKSSLWTVRPHLHRSCCVWHQGGFESGNHCKGNPLRGN